MSSYSVQVVTIMVCMCMFGCTDRGSEKNPRSGTKAVGIEIKDKNNESLNFSVADKAKQRRLFNSVFNAGSLEFNGSNLTLSGITIKGDGSEIVIDADLGRVRWSVLIGEEVYLFTLKTDKESVRELADEIEELVLETH